MAYRYIHVFVFRENAKTSNTRYVLEIPFILILKLLDVELPAETESRNNGNDMLVNNCKLYYTLKDD